MDALILNVVLIVLVAMLAEASKSRPAVVTRGMQVSREVLAKTTYHEMVEYFKVLFEEKRSMVLIRESAGKIQESYITKGNQISKIANAKKHALIHDGMKMDVQMKHKDLVFTSAGLSKDQAYFEELEQSWQLKSADSSGIDTTHLRALNTHHRAHLLARRGNLQRLLQNISSKALLEKNQIQQSLYWTNLRLDLQDRYRDMIDTRFH